MRAIWIGLGAGIAGLAGAALFWPDAQARALPWQDAQAAARGHVVYDENCASCHGVKLEGQPNWRQRDAEGFLPAPPHDSSGHTWHHPDAQLIDLVARGTAAVVGQGYESNMPGYGDLLSPEDIRAVLAYVKSTWPADVIAAHDDINARAATASR